MRGDKCIAEFPSEFESRPSFPAAGPKKLADKMTMKGGLAALYRRIMAVNLCHVTVVEDGEGMNLFVRLYHT